MPCTADTPTTDVDLEMLLAGEGLPEVKAHVRRCPSCREHLKLLADEDLALRRRLFRVNCPQPEVLGEWHLGWLEREDALQIEMHVSNCSHCREEVVLLDEVLNLPMREASTISLPMRRLVAQLVSALGQERGAPLRPGFQLRGGNAGVHCYRAGDITITLDVERQPDQLFRIVGLIVADAAQIGQFEGRIASLKRGAQEIAVAQVDDLDTFVLANVPLDEYTLEIASETEVVVIENVALE